MNARVRSAVSLAALTFLVANAYHALSLAARLGLAVRDGTMFDPVALAALIAGEYD